MYFPYLRGKQFELIALREMSDFMSKKKNKISPIIEPVKESSTLTSTLKELRQKNVNFNLIVNPQVGVMQTGKILQEISKTLDGYDNFQVGVILTRKGYRPVLSALRKHQTTMPGLTLIHDEMFDNIDDILAEFSEIAAIKFNVVNLSKTNRRYYRTFKKGTVVELDDYFKSQQKNSDYKDIDESTFSEEHLFYKDEGFVGFSDFLTVGDNYSEGGFLPYAVAIHLSFDDGDKKIRIKHFVSDSNNDSSDIAGKFEEALGKLVAWCDYNSFSTRAVEAFVELHETGHFPGLGSLKKLSITNHIEVVLRLI